MKKLLIALNLYVSAGMQRIQSRLSERQFLVLSAVLVGISGALMAGLLKALVHWIRREVVARVAVNQELEWLFAVLPVVGILLTYYVVKRFFKGKLNRGNRVIIEAIEEKESLVGREHIFGHVVTSALTVGFGGSAGLEAPLVLTGAAVGSNYGRTYRFDEKGRTLMLAAGAAAAISAAFNAPIAGLLFSLEVLLVEASINAFMPIILASACAALFSNLFLDHRSLLPLQVTDTYATRDLWFYPLLGLMTGLMALYQTRIIYRLDQRLQQKGWVPRTSGLLTLAGLMALFPPFFGEGFDAVVDFAKGRQDELSDLSALSWFWDQKGGHLLFIALLIFIKPVATALTLGTGGNGGNFAPAMFTGAALGWLLSDVIRRFGLGEPQTTHFVLIGMAGMVSGVFYAPLTGVFLIAELSGGYLLMIPLMLVSALSYATVAGIRPVPYERRGFARWMKKKVE